MTAAAVREPIPRPFSAPQRRPESHPTVAMSHGIFHSEPIARAAHHTTWTSGPIRSVRFDALGTTIEAVRIGRAQPQWVTADNFCDHDEALIEALESGSGVVLCVDDNSQIVVFHTYSYTGG